MTLNALAVESEDLADHLAVRIARIRQVRSAVTGHFRPVRAILIAANIESHELRSDIHLAVDRKSSLAVAMR